MSAKSCAAMHVLVCVKGLHQHLAWTCSIRGSRAKVPVTWESRDSGVAAGQTKYLSPAAGDTHFVYVCINLPLTKLYQISQRGDQDEAIGGVTVRVLSVSALIYVAGHVCTYCIHVCCTY